jgi:class 3 adenylate cyclase
MDENTRVKRRLTAILAADAVGYSARMAENEERTLHTLAGHRRLIDNLITDHGGRIVGTAGDSVLSEFASSVDAVRCAVEIQEALATRNASLSTDEQLRFRIGINLGDVIVDGDDILGDGVNVASRLEGIAEPGGICIASSVFDQISGKLNLGFEDIGERPLKNIGRPVRAYRVARAGAPVRVARGSRATASAAIAATLAALAIALTAFYLMRPDDQGAARSTAAANGLRPLTATATSPQPAASQPSAIAPATTTEVRPQSAPVTAAPATSPTNEIAGSASTGKAALPSPRPAAAPSRTVNQNQRDITYTEGLVQARCQRPDGNPGPLLRGRVRVEAGDVVIALGAPDQPGRVELRGRPEADGTLVLDGYIIPGAGPGRGTKVAARYQGRLTNGRGMLTGNQGPQRCSLRLQLK